MYNLYFPQKKSERKGGIIYIYNFEENIVFLYIFNFIQLYFNSTCSRREILYTHFSPSFSFSYNINLTKTYNMHVYIYETEKFGISISVIQQKPHAETTCFFHRIGAMRYV